MTNKEKGYKMIMLVDDNEIDNFVHLKLLETTGFAERIFVNTGGRSAIEFLKNVCRNGQVIGELMPDIIFLDISMPLMDGTQFLREFRQLPEPYRRNTRIVMLTAANDLAEKTKFTEDELVIAYWNKPLTKEYLESLPMSLK